MLGHILLSEQASSDLLPATGFGDGPKRLNEYRTAAMNVSLVAIPITAYGKGPATALVGASEWLLTGVRARVNMQAGWAQEHLVARAAAVLFVVLPVGDGTGEWKTVVVPGRIDT